MLVSAAYLVQYKKGLHKMKNTRVCCQQTSVFYLYTWMIYIYYGPLQCKTLG